MNSLQELVQQNLHIHPPVLFIVLNELLDVKIQYKSKYNSLYKCFILTTNIYVNNSKIDIGYFFDILLNTF